jgi:hypothetical protein
LDSNLKVSMNQVRTLHGSEVDGKKSDGQPSLFLI